MDENLSFYSTTCTTHIFQITKGENIHHYCEIDNGKQAVIIKFEVTTLHHYCEIDNGKRAVIIKFEVTSQI